MSKEFNLKIRNVTFIQDFMLYCNLSWFKFNVLYNPIFYNKSYDNIITLFKEHLKKDLTISEYVRLDDCLNIVFAYETQSMLSLYQKYNKPLSTKPMDFLISIVVDENKFDLINKSENLFKIINPVKIYDTNDPKAEFDMGKLISNKEQIAASYIKEQMEQGFFYEIYQKLTWKKLDSLPDTFKKVVNGKSILQTLSLESNFNDVCNENFIATELNKITNNDWIKKIDFDTFKFDIKEFCEISAGIRFIYVQQSNLSSGNISLDDKKKKQNELINQNMFYLKIPIKDCIYEESLNQQLIFQNNKIDYQYMIKKLNEKEAMKNLLLEINSEFYTTAIVNNAINTLDKLFDIAAEKDKTISFSMQTLSSSKEAIIERIGEFL